MVKRLVVYINGCFQTLYTELLLTYVIRFTCTFSKRNFTRSVVLLAWTRNYFSYEYLEERCSSARV